MYDILIIIMFIFVLTRTAIDVILFLSKKYYNRKLLEVVKQMDKKDLLKQMEKLDELSSRHNMRKLHELLKERLKEDLENEEENKEEKTNN